MDTVATPGPVTPSLDKASRDELAAARAALHGRDGLVVRSADLLGRIGMRLLHPIGLVRDNKVLTAIAETALERAYDIAILGLKQPASGPGAGMRLVAASGAIGGFVGPVGFLPDALLTTLLIMREIARAARDAGEDLSTEAGRAACVHVFTLREGDEAGYLSARFALQGTAARTLLAGVAARWGTVLGEKFAAQAVPLLGAIAGATLNTAFLTHYRRLARAHFSIRRLERKFGPAAIQAAAPELRPVDDARFFEG
jgi:EcsC protein family